MEGGIIPGDHLLVDKLSYVPLFGLPPLRRVRRGDIISFLQPGGKLVLVKRVIALGGDRVDLRDGQVRVNGHTIQEPYRVLLRRPASLSQSFLVPADSYFVMGDNRDLSEDSRAFGAVPARNLIGEPLLVCWSFARSWQDWLDDHGHTRMAAYGSLLEHPLGSVRWERTGKLLR